MAISRVRLRIAPTEALEHPLDSLAVAIQREARDAAAETLTTRYAAKLAAQVESDAAHLAAEEAFQSVRQLNNTRTTRLLGELAATRGPGAAVILACQQAGSGTFRKGSFRSIAALEDGRLVGVFETHRTNPISEATYGHQRATLKTSFVEITPEFLFEARITRADLIAATRSLLEDVRTATREKKVNALLDEIVVRPGRRRDEVPRELLDLPLSAAVGEV